jgi:hypothetical protein
VGAAICVFVSGIPELVTRHDPEAMGEPGALMGALVQLLLLLVVVALAIVVDLELRRTSAPCHTWQLHRAPVPPPEPLPRGGVRRLDANPRGPPGDPRRALSH